MSHYCDIFIKFLDYIPYGMISVGIFFIISAVVGLIRFKNFFIKIHISGMVDSFAIPITLIGFALLHRDNTVHMMKILFIVVLFWITQPVGSHMLAKAASIYYTHWQNKNWQIKKSQNNETKEL